jgi:hypothetical protein
MANAIAHQRNVLEVQKPVEVPIFTFVKKFEFYFATQYFKPPPQVCKRQVTPQNPLALLFFIQRWQSKQKSSLLETFTTEALRIFKAF